MTVGMPTNPMTTEHLNEPPDDTSQVAAVANRPSSLALRVSRYIGLGLISGLLAGVASTVFLELLDRATSFRLSHGLTIYLLPLAGALVGLAYQHLGGRAARGNQLLLEQIHEPTEWIPRRMAPLVLVATLVSHLVGASVGREGTAIQMSGSLSDWFARLVKLGPNERKLILIAAIAGGFGSVFGVPIAGAIFAIEVQSLRKFRFDAGLAAFVAAYSGDAVARVLGARHPVRAPWSLELGAANLAKVALAGAVCGLVSMTFIGAVHAVKCAAAHVKLPAMRPVIGGLVTLGGVAVVGRDYLGLSLGLIDRGLAGEHVAVGTPALKLAFTAVALGSGFVGGEVTPLFVIGTTLGAVLAPALGLPIPVLAGIGFVAVFAGATNTPLACTAMGIELFGTTAAVPLALGCLCAYVFSSHRTIYSPHGVNQTPVGESGKQGDDVLDQQHRE